jgi:hypothetical protein
VSPKLLPVLNHSGATGGDSAERLDFEARTIQPELGLNVVSRVRIELTTRGFSIQDTNQERSGSDHAVSRHASAGLASSFDLNLTTSEQIAFSRGLLVA